MEPLSEQPPAGFAISSQPGAARTDTFRMKALTARIHEETSDVHEDGLRARRFGLVPDAAQSMWDSAAISKAAITTDTLLHAVVPSANLPADAEQRIIDAIMRPQRVGESRAETSARRENELLELFAELTPARACQLRKRLDNDRADDRVVVAFRRLIVERRQRLYAALVGRRR